MKKQFADKKKECDFNQPVTNKMFYLVLFSCTNYLLNAKCTSEKLLAKYTIFKFYTTKAPKNIAFVVLDKEFK